MFEEATIGPFADPTAVLAVASEDREVVESKAVEPESLLSRGAFPMLMLLLSLATPPAECWKIGAVFVLIKAACAIAIDGGHAPD
jgi:hypothetical protein